MIRSGVVRRRKWMLGIAAVVAASACSQEPAPATATPPPPPPVTPAPAGAVDLSSESVGGEPKAFVALAGNWVVADEDGQKVVMADGRTWTAGTMPAQLDEKARVVFPAAAPAFATRVAGALNFPFAAARDISEFGSGEVTVRFKLVGGESDQFASIMFGLQPNADYLALRYNTKDHDVALWRVKDGQRERVAEGGTKADVALGEWRQLRLVVNGPSVEGYLDDRKMLAHTLPQPPRGRVGLWAKPDSVTAYKDYRVTPSR